MSVTKKNPSGDQIWQNTDITNLHFMSNPQAGGFGDFTPIADCRFEGIPPSDVKLLDALGNEIIQVTAPVADCMFSGIVPSQIYCSVAGIVAPAADCRFEGCEVEPAYSPTAPVADCNFEGIEVEPAYSPTAPVADCNFEGIAQSQIDCSTAGIVAPAANCNFEGYTVYPVIQQTFVFTFGPIARIADCDFEGIAVEPAYSPTAAIADCDFEGIATRVGFTIGSDVQTKTLYQCVLTGSADGETDLILPISNLSIRLRDGDPTYCSVTVPSVTTYQDEITSRLNGQLVIRRGAEFSTGKQIFSEICRVDLEETPYDIGPRSSSFQLIGHTTEDNSLPETIDIRPIQVFSVQSSGLRRVRCQPAFSLRSGDTVIYGDDGETFVAGLISIVAGASEKKFNESMEVTEYAP